MKGFVPKTTRLVELIMAFALAVMVVMIGGNVILRYIFHTGIAASEEISRLMFVWLIFLGAILAMGKGAHLGMEIFQAKLPKSVRKVCAVVSHVLVLYALWLFLQGSWDQTLIGLDAKSTVLGFSMAWPPAGGLVCAAVMILIVLVNLVRILINHPAAKIAGEAYSLIPEEAAIAMEAAQGHKAETKEHGSTK